MNMKPFFCYYGGKWRGAKHYPSPKYSTIIEPFAGGAGYATWHNASRVKLYEVDERIYGIWKFLIGSSPEDIYNLPTVITHVDDYKICQEAKWLIGFWCNKGCAHPMKQPSIWMKEYNCPNSWWGESIKHRIASQLSQIKHWEIYNTSYVDIDNIKASWYIDPPYQNKCGRRYKHNQIDFESLGNWCRGRLGEVMVCEQSGATWLPFKEFKDLKSCNRTLEGTLKSKEVLYYQH